MFFAIFGLIAKLLTKFPFLNWLFLTLCTIIAYSVLVYFYFCFMFIHVALFGIFNDQYFQNYVVTYKSNAHISVLAFLNIIASIGALVLQVLASKFLYFCEEWYFYSLPIITAGLLSLCLIYLVLLFLYHAGRKIYEYALIKLPVKALKLKLANLRAAEVLE